ncbi:hypothetical protein PsYK624_009750 [Phanerochaete sordida]|uniref:Uncharacterized protein n=1 Tax=Phanerochaete sordida TaxID=48140 RepID=A0A9P3FZ03_9APHY|nr:hypothetical protein PsYK624_009750 [Phanerochaete sordida]
MLAAHDDAAPRRGRPPLPKNRKMEFREDRVAKPMPSTEPHGVADGIVYEWLAALKTCFDAAAELAAGNAQARPVYRASLPRAKKALEGMSGSARIISVEVFKRTHLRDELDALLAYNIDGRRVQIDMELERGVGEVVEVVRKRLAAAQK